VFFEPYDCIVTICKTGISSIAEGREILHTKTPRRDLMMARI